jgi:hypothetical protein
MAEIVDLAARRPRIEISVERLYDDLMRQIAIAPDGNAAALLAFREAARVLVDNGVTPNQLLDYANLVARGMVELQMIEQTTITTIEDANRWLGRFKIYDQMSFDLAALIVAGRPGGPPVDENTNIIAYWPPAEIRAWFQQACVDAQAQESTIIDLVRLGQDGRLDLLGRCCRLLGITVGRRPLETSFERMMVETEIGRTWLLACISDDQETLRRLGAIP